ncbi:MAG: metallophosphoesterase [Victivallaceae bacterium]
MIFFPEKRSRKKFSHRVPAWEQISGYSARNIAFQGKYLDVVKYSIPAAEPGLAGRKIVFFSDLHWRGGTAAEKKILSEISEFIRKIQPDAIICGGDLISFASRIKSAMEALKSLPPAPVRIAVHGNWEQSKKWISDSKWKQYFQEAGYDLLVNQACPAPPFCFYGTDDVRLGSPEINIGNTGQYNVAACHSPDTAIYAGRTDILRNIKLFLCGHTHAGQVRFPVIGPLTASSRYRLKFAYGQFIHNKTGTRMIISSGIGMSCLPVRLFCRPEIIFIEFVNSV